MFYYYGGKRMSAKKYPAPVHDVVVEPFAGAAGYAINHLVQGSIDRAILIEKDPRVVELWDRLLGMTPDEVLAIEVPEVGSKTSDFLIMTSATSNAVARCRQMTVTSRMPKIVETMLRRIAEFLPHVVGKVDVICGDYRDAPDIEATWFIDPPYQPHLDKKTSTKTVFPQGMGYSRECSADRIDYAALGEWSMTRKGQVVVVEQEGADWMPFTPLFDAHDSQGKKKREVVWVSGSD